MVKFTVTVSDGYIRERADVEHFNVTDNNPVKSIMDLMAFSTIERKLDNNQVVEYNIDSKIFNKETEIDSKKLTLFNDVVSLLAVLSVLTKFEEATK